MYGCSVQHAPLPHKFTGKERDSESGLDNFEARYYASTLGRFMRPDDPNVDQDPADPQSWNLYSYVRNNPLSNVDPDCKDALDYVKGVGQGLRNFAVNTATGLKTAVQHPTTIVTGTVDALKTAGQAYFSAAGRSQLASQFSSLSTQEKTAVVTEALTQGVAAVALTKGVGVAAKGATGAAATAEVGAETTQLFRAVGSAEAKSIGETGAFTPSPTGREFKGFFFNEADAQSFGSRITEMTGDPHTVVPGEAPTDLVNSSPAHNAATEGPGVLIKNENLPEVKPKPKRQ